MGILCAMMIAPNLGSALRSLAQALLVDDFPQSTLTRGERELVATYVSMRNRCVFCMDSHAQFAAALAKTGGGQEISANELLSGLLCGRNLTDKVYFPELLAIADLVRASTDALQPVHVENAIARGASTGDVQVVILIGAAFSMYNRIVDGFHARTPDSIEKYADRSSQIAENGYILQ